MADLKILQLGRGTPGTVLTFTNHILDSATDAIAWITQAEEGATITHIGFRQGAVTGTSPVYIVGFQTKQTDGEPDGTYLGGGSPQSATFTPVGGGDGLWQFIALDNSRVVTRGEVLCIVIEHSSGTVDGSNNCSFTQRSGAQDVGDWTFPYVATENLGSWTLQDDYPVWGMKSASRSYGNGFEASTKVSADSADTPDEFGAAFTFPDGITDTVNIIGARLVTDWNNLAAGGSFILSLYQDTTLLQEASIAGRAGSIANKLLEMLFDESTLSDLSPGTEYIIAWHTDHTTVTIALFHDTFDSAAEANVDPWGMPSLNVGYVTRTNAGAWSAKDTTLIPRVALLLNDMTEPAGGGGMRLAGKGGLAA